MPAMEIIPKVTPTPMPARAEALIVGPGDSESGAWPIADDGEVADGSASESGTAGSVSGSGTGEGVTMTVSDVVTVDVAEPASTGRVAATALVRRPL
jgi:hypothetical protein